MQIYIDISNLCKNTLGDHNARPVEDKTTSARHGRWGVDHAERHPAIREEGEHRLVDTYSVQSKCMVAWWHRQPH